MRQTAANQLSVAFPGSPLDPQFLPVTGGAGGAWLASIVSPSSKHSYFVLIPSFSQIRTIYA